MPVSPAEDSINHNDFYSVLVSLRHKDGFF